MQLNRKLQLLPDKLMNHLFDYVCQKDNHKNCSYTTNFASHFRWKKQLTENEAYGEGCKLEFEGCLFTAPCGYEKILKISMEAIICSFLRKKKELPIVS